MKKTYEKPSLAKPAKLQAIAALPGSGAPG
jgi:hypothetical protein